MSKNCISANKKFLSQIIFCLGKIAKLARSRSFKLCLKWRQSASPPIGSPNNEIMPPRSSSAVAPTAFGIAPSLGLPRLIYYPSYGHGVSITKEVYFRQAKMYHVTDDMIIESYIWFTSVEIPTVVGWRFEDTNELKRIRNTKIDVQTTQCTKE